MLATADHLKGAFRVFEAHPVAGENTSKVAVLFQENVDLLAEQFGRGIAEHVFGRAIQPLDRPVETRSDDGVGRGIDDGVIARVLPLAQDPLPGHRYGDVIDLHKAMPGATRRQWPDDDIVQQLLSGLVPQRQQRIERMRQDARASDLDRFLEDNRQPGIAQGGKYIE